MTEKPAKKNNTDAFYLPRKFSQKDKLFAELPKQTLHQYRAACHKYPMLLASLHEGVSDWRKAEARLSPFTRFIFLWLDYALACENLACMFFASPKFAKHYHTPGLVASRSLTDEQNKLCRAESESRLEYVKAAEQFLGYLFTQNELWDLPVFAYPLEVIIFSDWIEAATSIHGEMGKRIKHAFNFDTWGKHESGNEGKKKKHINKSDIREVSDLILENISENEVYYTDDFLTLWAKIKGKRYQWALATSQTILISLFIRNPSMVFNLAKIQGKYEDAGGKAETKHFRLADYFRDDKKEILGKIILQANNRYQLNPRLTFTCLAYNNPIEKPQKKPQKKSKKK